MIVLEKKVQRVLLKNWFKDYVHYATKAQLRLRPRAVKLDGMPTGKNKKHHDGAFMKYHSDNEETNRRLAIIDKMKSISDRWSLYGDILYYLYVLGYSAEETSSQLGIDRKKVYQYSTAGLDVAATLTPLFWYTPLRNGLYR